VVPRAASLELGPGTLVAHGLTAMLSRPRGLPTCRVNRE
jgi:hypothetical protein